MMNRTLRVGAASLGFFSLVACGGNRDAAGRDSTAAALADSQSGVNAPSDTAMMRNDSLLRRDTTSGLSMPTDGPNRNAGKGVKRRP